MKINFNIENYEVFHDYKDIMVEAFGIGCSTCGDAEIIYVLKNGPKPIGTLIHELGANLTDLQIDKLIEKPLQTWQEFDDKNSENTIPTYLCSECWNTIQE